MFSGIRWLCLGKSSCFHKRTDQNLQSIRERFEGSDLLAHSPECAHDRAMSWDPIEEKFVYVVLMLQKKPPEALAVADEYWVQWHKGIRGDRTQKCLHHVITALGGCRTCDRKLVFCAPSMRFVSVHSCMRAALYAELERQGFADGTVGPKGDMFVCPALVATELSARWFALSRCRHGNSRCRAIAHIVGHMRLD